MPIKTGGKLTIEEPAEIAAPVEEPVIAEEDYGKGRKKGSGNLFAALIRENRIYRTCNDNGKKVL
jgi:hypothetical protein